MIKAFCRFSLLLILCLLFVYTPEILSAVSAPYKLAAPKRILLRIALSCDHETSALINQALTAYSKDHPTVHLRVTHTTAQQLSSLTSTYPDVILCTPQSAAQLPSGFVPAAGNSHLLCAVPLNPPAHGAVSEFAAYIVEALPAQDVPS